ncbi:MAG: tRNA-binding protein [Paracoccaceae bacterium]|jgi:tRNA-binding protein|nr:tRNA-binding protein [Paracoccaceae bacterium]MDC0039957.1 tRNA-binding protein [Paracoccaceae bacterium]MDG1879658.1 tRNA-binding protein [Paracoccaceae bacterium]MDG1940385.1 tRNA-binding protein [Paracoccaceae bacterium]|tara:strand:+ start:2721 stop:3059 length:339 start_codon:yes stop_codon:yes gene_type:complete
MSIISFDEFAKVDIRVGEIVEATTFPEARKPALKLRINFGGDVGIKKSSAQITHHYHPDELIGKSVLAVVNFAPRQIGKFMSEVLVLGLSDSNNDIVLVIPDGDVHVGAKLH